MADALRQNNRMPDEVTADQIVSDEMVALTIC